MNFTQWKTTKPETLPILHFICLSMTSLDRYISLNQDQEQTYYRIATTIDAELNKFGDDNAKQVLPLLKGGNWNQLSDILDNLKKAAIVHKSGVADKKYRQAVIKLSCELNTLITETKHRLLIDINPDADVNDEKILALNQRLKDIKYLYKLSEKFFL